MTTSTVPPDPDRKLPALWGERVRELAREHEAHCGGVVVSPCLPPIADTRTLWQWLWEGGQPDREQIQHIDHRDAEIEPEIGA
jgi:hypothetical protein